MVSSKVLLWFDNDRQSDYMLHEFSSSTNACPNAPGFLRLSGPEHHAEIPPAKLTEYAVPLNRDLYTRFKVWENGEDGGYQ